MAMLVLPHGQNTLFSNADFCFHVILKGHDQFHHSYWHSQLSFLAGGNFHHLWEDVRIISSLLTLQCIKLSAITFSWSDRLLFHLLHFLWEHTFRTHSEKWRHCCWCLEALELQISSSQMRSILLVSVLSDQIAGLVCTSMPPSQYNSPFLGLIDICSL